MAVVAVSVGVRELLLGCWAVVGELQDPNQVCLGTVSEVKTLEDEECTEASCWDVATVLPVAGKSSETVARSSFLEHRAFAEMVDGQDVVEACYWAAAAVSLRQE